MVLQIVLVLGLVLFFLGLEIGWNIVTCLVLGLVLGIDFEIVKDERVEVAAEQVV